MLKFTMYFQFCDVAPTGRKSHPTTTSKWPMGQQLIITVIAHVGYILLASRWVEKSLMIVKLVDAWMLACQSTTDKMMFIYY